MWRNYMGWQPPLFPGGNLTIRRSMDVPAPLLAAMVDRLTDPDPETSLAEHYARRMAQR